MKRNVAWIDRYSKSYSMEEITDSHLLNILRFICNGGGYTYFLTREKIVDLFNEADKRGLAHNNILQVAINTRDIKDLAEEMRMIMSHEDNF